MPRGVAAGVVAAVLVVAPVSSAWAVDGSWWYDAYGVAEVNAQGADGDGVTIAVIDDGINTQVPMLQGADITVHEPSFCTGEDLISREPSPAETTDLFEAFHGTNVVAHIVGNGQGYDGQPSIRGIAPKAHVILYDNQGYYEPNEDGSYSNKINCSNPDPGGPDPFAVAVVQAVDDGADIISISQEVRMHTGDTVSEAFAYAMHQGVIVVHGLSNDINDEGANGAVRVQAIGPDLEPATDGARDRDVLRHRTVVAAGGQMLLQGNVTTGLWEDTGISPGSSLATPLVAGMLADVWSVYPDATGNQLIQSLIRNTGSEDHELGYDEIYGYGAASVGHMLRAGDPAQYPDENPLIVSVEDDRGSALPTSEQIAAGVRPAWASPVDGVTPSPSPSPTATPSPDETVGSGGSAASDAPKGDASAGAGAAGWVLPVALAVVGLVVVAGVVTLVVVLSRRRRPAPVVAGAAPGQGYPPPGPAYGQPMAPGQPYPGPGGYPPGQPSYPPPPYPPQAGSPPQAWPQPGEGPQQGDSR